MVFTPRSNSSLTSPPADAPDAALSPAAPSQFLASSTSFGDLAVRSSAPSLPLLGKFDDLGIGGVSAVRGGGVASTPTIKREGRESLQGAVVIGHNVALINDPEGLCCGHIGLGKTKFCILRKYECSTATHQRSKEEGVEKGLYALDSTPRGGKATCLLNPHIAAEDLSLAMITFVLKEKLSLSEALSKFALLSNGEIDTEDKMYQATSAVAKAKAAKTPFKAGGRMLDTSSIQDEFSTAFNRFYEDKVKLDTKSNDLVVPLLEDSPLAIGMLREEMKMVNNFLGRLTSMMDRNSWEINEEVSNHGGALFGLKQLEMMVGKQNNTLVLKGVEPTVWDAIATLDATLSGSGALVDGKLEATVSHISQDLRTVLISYKEAITKADTRLTNLETQPRGQDSNPANPDNLLLSAALGIARSEVTNVPTGELNVASQSAGLSGRTDTSALEMLGKKIDALEDYNQQRDNQALFEAVRICDVTFTSEEDVANWMSKYGPSPDKIPKYGIFFDPLLLFHWTWKRLSGNNSMVSDLTSQKKLSMTEMDLRCRESYGMDVPFVFTGSGSSSLLDTGGIESSRFSNVKVFKAWESHGLVTGLRNKIESAANMIKTSVSARIDTEFRGHPYVISLAKEMLSISHSFLQALNQYMTDTFQSFQSFEIGSDKEVWGLITFVVEQLFKKDFAEMRQTAIGALDLDCRDSAFRAMWCALRCVKLAQKLIVTGIKDTPSVSASYVRFVLTQSNMGKVGKIVEDNLILKRKICELEGGLAEVRKLAAEAVKRSDQAMGKVNANKKKKRNDEDE